MASAERLTRRLLARPPTEADRASYHSHFTKPELERWLRPPPLLPFDARALDELALGDREHWQDHGFGPWLLFDRRTEEFVGRGGLSWTTVEGAAEVELPWSIEPHCHGEGLATEAALAAVEWASELGFERVIALILPSNSASRRVAEKAGFGRDGECEHAGLPHLLFGVRLSARKSTTPSM